MLKKYHIIIPTVAFFVIVLLLGSLYLAFMHSIVEQSRQKYYYIASSYTNIIRDCLDTVLARASTLSIMIMEHGGDMAFFDTSAQVIYEKIETDTGVKLRNIAVAPGGVVKKVYPLISNEGFIGFNFMDASRPGNAEAIEAYQKGKLIITNPFKLVQGGVGIAGRMPVFLHNNNISRFWGLVTVTMDHKTLMNALHLERLIKIGVNYELWYKDDSGKHISLSSSAQLPKDPVSVPLLFENITWYLDVAPITGWYDYAALIIGFAIILGLALLSSLLIFAGLSMRNSNDKLQQLAYRDGLTACYTRNFVNTILLNQRNGHWNDPNSKFSIAIIDIDYFKEVNDIYGHEIGDRALAAVAQVLKDSIKAKNGDYVIRHGGDEFIVLWNNISAESFCKNLESIVEKVRRIHFTDFPDIKFSVSIGGESYVNAKQPFYYDMIRIADQKLYIAKENGRNQFVC